MAYPRQPTVQPDQAPGLPPSDTTCSRKSASTLQSVESAAQQARRKTGSQDAYTEGRRSLVAMNKVRWNEVRFIDLCNRLHGIAENYTIAVNYISILADIANVDQIVALRLLQKIHQNPSLQAGRVEAILLGKQNGASINNIVKLLHISKRDYIIYAQGINLETPIAAKLTREEDEIVEKLLEAHNKLKGVIAI